MFRLMKAGGFALFAVIPGLGALADDYKGYEMPPFTVVATHGDVEVREYGPHVVAEVTTTGARRSAASSGFRSLFRYISGANATGEKIAMTVPVTQMPMKNDTWAIRFMMPDAAAARGLPDAKDGNLTLRQLEGGREAVLSFSGLSTASAIDRASATLLKTIEEAGLTPGSPVRFYFYDDPFTPPWKRRTEVAVSLRAPTN